MPRLLLIMTMLLPLLLPAQTPGTVRRGVLTVECLPADAVLTIDGGPALILPFRDSLPAGPHLLNLSGTGFQTFTETIILQADSLRRFRTRLRPVPGLTILTTPSHAAVLVDGAAVGTTPIVGLPLTPGPHTVALRLEEHRTKDFTLRVDSGDGIVRNVTMIPVFGFLSVQAMPAGARITLDDTAASDAPIGPLKVPVGQHSIRITHPDHPLPVEGTIDIGAAQHARIVNDLTAPSYRALLISAFVPGLGQALDGHWLEGTAELGAMTTAVFAVKNALHNVSVAEHDLAVAQSGYDAAANENTAFRRRTDLLRTQSTLGTARRSRALLISGAASLYALILADAAIDHSFIHWLQIEEVRPVPVVNDRYEAGWTAATVKVPL